MRKRRRKNPVLVYVLEGVIVVLCVGLLGGAGMLWHSQKKEQKVEKQVEASGNKGTEVIKIEKEEKVKQVTIMAVGDNLIHEAVWQSGLQEDGSHDYRPLYENLSYYLENCDLRVINQETILGGDEKGLRDYPIFNSPQAIGDTLADMGFNVILHASNHSFDMGIDGLMSCAQFWKQKHPEVTMVGIYESPEEQDQIPVVEVNGIKIALLNYTYSHNAGSFGVKAEGHLNMLCAYDNTSRVIDFQTIHPKVLEDIRKAEELADFTIVFPHWGTEYVMQPTLQETTFASQMTEAGADLIIGTHPHVIQPVEWVTAGNGNRALCYYSLGNFTSAQDGVAQMLGGMANLTIVQDKTGTYIQEDSIKAIPLVTHFVYPGWTGSSVVESTYLLNNYTDEQAAKHGLKTAWRITLTRQELLSLAEQTFGEYLSME